MIYPEVVIGDRFIAHAHVTVRERVRIGSDVILHSGAVIGSDGLRLSCPTDGGIRRLLQAGDVVIEDEVEIGANTTVDRAMVGSTILRRGVKLDNLVMIAHGCEIGEYSMLAAQVGLSGSTRVGKWVRMGGQVGSGRASDDRRRGADRRHRAASPTRSPPARSSAGRRRSRSPLAPRDGAATHGFPSCCERVRRIEQHLGAAPKRRDAT